MSCHLVASLLSDALDGAVRRDEERLVEAHVALCRDCAELRDDLSAMRELLRECGPVARDDRDDERLFERLREHEPGTLATLLSLARRALPRPGLMSSSAFAGALVLTFAVLAGGPAEAPDPPPLGAARPAATFAPLAEAGTVRDSGVLTVWDSSGDRIVATVDPAGQAQDDLVRRASLRDDGRAPAATSQVHQVRIVLFQRIVVKG